MTLIVDAAPLIALNVRSDPDRMKVDALLRAYRGDLVIPSPVTAEVDYFLATKFPLGASKAFLTDLADGRFRVECLAADDYEAILRLSEQYAHLRPGLADLSIVVLAQRFRTRQIVTFDHRHFRTIRPLQGGEFVVLPDDQPSI